MLEIFVLPSPFIFPLAVIFCETVKPPFIESPVNVPTEVKLDAVIELANVLPDSADPEPENVVTVANDKPPLPSVCKN